jgi:hypothetical protein
VRPVWGVRKDWAGEQSLVESPAGVSSGHSTRRQARLVRHSKAEKVEQRIGRAAKRAGEGPNGASPQWGGK